MKTLLILLSAIALVPIGANSQNASVDFDRRVDFSKFETFAWRDGTPVENDLSDHRITSAVENELGIKGYWQEEQEPDMYLVYHASAKEEVDLAGADYRASWKSPATLKVEKHIAGTLVLDMLDAKKGHLLWRGIATATVDPNLQKNQTIINKAVRKLLEGFPP